MNNPLFLPHTIKKIAVFRALQLGDLLCAIPTFRALRTYFPKAKITLIGLPFQKDFQKRFHRYLDNFVAFPGFPGFPEQEPYLQQFPSFIEHMQEEQFDLVLQLQGNGTLSNPLVTLFNGRITAGLKGEDSFSPNEAYFAPYPQKGHEIHRLLMILNSLSIPEVGDYLEFPILTKERKEAVAVAKEHHLDPFSYICIHPGSRSNERRWDLKKFAQVADVATTQGYTVVFTGTKEEESIVKTVQRHMSHFSLSLAGKTPLGATASLLKQARLLITNDTGISHVASALKTPSIVIFTGSEMERWAPLNKRLHKALNGKSSDSLERLLLMLSDILSTTTSHQSLQRKEQFFSI